MASEEVLTIGPWVDIRETPVLALKDCGEGRKKDPEVLRAEAKRMSDSEIAALSGKPGTRDKVISVGIEAAFRGMLSPAEQARLLGLMEDQGRGGVPPLSQIVPRESNEEKHLRRLAASVGLSLEQARQLGQRGLTVAQIQELLAEFRGANRKGAA